MSTIDEGIEEQNQRQCRQWADELGPVFSHKYKPTGEEVVCSIEGKHRKASDVCKLLEVIEEAIKEMSNPRRRWSKGGKGEKMSDDARNMLKQQKQSRLRSVLIHSLRKVLDIQKDYEPMEKALSTLRSMIKGFEKKGDPICDAAAAKQWSQIAELVDHNHKGYARIGKGTLCLIEEALRYNTGRATRDEICAFIRSHPEVVRGHDAQLNQSVGTGVPLWQETVAACLTQNFCAEEESAKRHKIYVLRRLPGRGSIGGIAGASLPRWSSLGQNPKVKRMKMFKEK